jgi:hypothetical protein
VARNPNTFVPHRPYRTSIWTALVLLQALLAAFAIFALFLGHEHAWADRILAHVPMPGPATSLAADPSLAAQMRLIGRTAWYTRLADRTPVLVAEADVANDSLMPVNKIIVAAEAKVGGETKAKAIARCGKAVSNKLLGRMPREELATLLDLDPPAAPPLLPGETRRCQVAFAGMAPGAEEVVVRIVSVEPLPGHPRPHLRPGA